MGRFTVIPTYNNSPPFQPVAGNIFFFHKKLWGKSDCAQQNNSVIGLSLDAIEETALKKKFT